MLVDGTCFLYDKDGRWLALVAHVDDVLLAGP